MFGTNEIVGKRFFKDAPKDSLLVTSMFFTLQGEGPYAGLPALFIRLAKCNLNCRMCDTFFDQGDWMTFEQIETKVQNTIHDHWTSQGKEVPQWVAPNTLQTGVTKFGPYPGIILVITGGEPLLQDNLNVFLIRQIDSGYKEVQIESNGLLNTRIPGYVKLVCSPKCAEKDGKAIKYLEPSQTMLERADCLKFVMCADQDSPYSKVPDWAHEWKKITGDEVYVSPMNIYNEVPQQAKILRLTKADGKLSMHERSTVDEVISWWTPGLLDNKANQINHEYAARYCLENGFRLSLQQHLYCSLA